MTPVKRAALLTTLGALAVAVLRSIRLGAMPIFNDEAIYVRWGQLIAADPSLAITVPLIDPKPPLHSLLIAVAMFFGGDPLLAGRFVSVLTAALMVPAIVLLLRELECPPRSIVASVVFTSVAPFLAFYQRMVLADALFALETVLCVWLALRMRRSKGAVVGFGVVMGTALLTRQVFSLALLPLTLVASGKFKRWLSGLGIAAALFSPYLLTRLDLYRNGIGAELRRRMFHHAQLSDSTDALAVIGFGGWLSHSLTPLMYIAAIASLLWLLIRRRRVAIILVLWVVVLIAPPVMFGSVTYPRYILAGTIPLLIAVGVAAGDVFRRPLVLAIVVAVLSLQPLSQLYRPRLLPIDRWQYVSGWPAGFAMEQAARWIDRELQSSPATLLTGEGWGIPDDVVWMRFAGDSRATLRFVRSNQGVPHLGTTETFSPTWDPDAQPAPLPPTGPVYYFDRVVNGAMKDHDASKLAGAPILFLNPSVDPSDARDGIVIFRLR